MTVRQQTAYRIVELVGPDAIALQDALDGWPALAELRVGDDIVPVALFVGPVGSSNRSRDDVERRFQNPGQNRPILVPPGRLPLLVGLWEQDELLPVTYPLLVTADPYRREGLVTRYSIFVSVDGLEEASRTGWSETVSGTGETIRCLLPPLLPTVASAMLGEAMPPPSQVQGAIDAAGLIADDEDDAATRARRATMALVRDARFSRRVVAAYGYACAMCGLGLGLVQGAHIYPAAAPRSSDEPWNGLALCANHHLAFDRHLIAVDPGTMAIYFDDELLSAEPFSDALDAFTATTLPRLEMPADRNLRPSPDSFDQRYRYFDGSYNWFLGDRR
jgi:hypothetical protein